MKKLFYGLGAVATVVTPVVAVVSCGSKTHELKSGTVTEASLIDLYKGYGHVLPEADAKLMVAQFGTDAKFVVMSDSKEYAEKIEVIILGKKRLTPAEAIAAAVKHLEEKKTATPDKATEIEAKITALNSSPLYYDLKSHPDITYTQDELSKVTYSITIDKDGVTGIRAVVNLDATKSVDSMLDSAVLGFRLNAIA